MKIAHIHIPTNTIRFISKNDNSLEDITSMVDNANSHESTNSPFYWKLVDDNIKEGDILNE